MKKRFYYINHRKTILYCDIYYNNEKFPIYSFSRNLVSFEVESTCCTNYVDITQHDLELHAFMRLSHQYIVNPDSMAGEKIEEMFELENLNI